MARKRLEAFVNWLHEEELSENTIDSYRYTVWEFLTRYQELTKENLLSWKNWLIDNHSVQTVNLRIAAMNRYIEFSKLKISPLKRIRTQKAISVENVITDDDYQKLIKGLIADGEVRWACYYRILANTGVRISEALQLTVRDLDRGFVMLKTKGKVRRIFLPKTLATDIKSLYKDAGPDSRLILNRYGQPMTSRGFAVVMQKHAEQYGIPKERMHPHALRHFFALQFIKRNPDVTLLADLLGHSNLKQR